MSWNIFVYAEVRGKNDDDWKPLVIPAVCDDFKYFNDGIIDELPYMSAKDAAHPTVKNLGDNVYGGCDFKVRYCTVRELRKHYSDVIKKMKAHLTASCLALGIRVNLDDDDWYGVNDYDDNDHVSDLFDKMTFPVNKELLSDLLVSICNSQKAYQVLGMCNTIESMCENYDDDLRLLFATM